MQESNFLSINVLSFNLHGKDSFDQMWISTSDLSGQVLIHLFTWNRLWGSNWLISASTGGQLRSLWRVICVWSAINLWWLSHKQHVCDSLSNYCPQVLDRLYWKLHPSPLSQTWLSGMDFVLYLNTANIDMNMSTETTDLGIFRKCRNKT